MKMVGVKKKLFQGISLTETLVALLILSILITVAIPTYGDLVVTNRITTASSELHGAFLFARSEAIKLHGNVIICRSSTTMSENPRCDQGSDGGGRGWGDGWLIFHDVDKDKQFSSKDTILRAQASLFSSRQEGSISSSPSRNQVTFNATGQTFGSYMRFHIRGPENQKTNRNDRYICVASGGRARISKEICA